jgi:hypothetical protein
VQNVTITALAKIQHFCIREERTTVFSVSVSRLPGQLDNFLKNCLLRACEMEIHCEVESQFEAFEILHLLTMLKNISMNMLLDTRYSVTMLLPLSCECTNEFFVMFTLVISF